MPSRSSEALRALSRFGLGARPGESGSVSDSRDWVTAQLTPPNAALISGTTLPTPETIGSALQALRDAQRSGDQERRQAARRRIQELAGHEARAALTERVRTDHPYIERLVAFWSNHLCVSIAGKPIIAPLAGAYERDVIRPHILGRFEDMVLASARHPAMLLYLDNAQSVGPNSRVGRVTRRRERARGLNENYARELLELHTLGVDGGYSQDDVLALAKVFTGWTILGVGERRNSIEDRAGEPGFRFVAAMHEPDAKTVLGKRYREDGQHEGETVIRDLCRHPSTARFVSQKLVQHFVSDRPVNTDVAAIAAVFQESEGDLHAVTTRLIELESAWDPENRKFRTPQDWLIAALRALGAHDYPQQLIPLLRALRHPLWAPSAPKGFDDTRESWADPDGLMNRAELARTIANRVARSGFEPAGILDTFDVRDGSPLPTLVADDSIDRSERLALALGGPDFQWR